MKTTSSTTPTLARTSDSAAAQGARLGTPIAVGREVEGEDVDPGRAATDTARLVPPRVLVEIALMPAGYPALMLKRFAQLALLKRGWDWWQARRSRRSV